ncbi:MAG: patatin-like phospholipase family protein [Bacteroides sp.]|nr:patatin-like phospholipase family protein [Bacteroides sp.]
MVLILSGAALSAQSVGLVLSGGGSKGLGHIGVIKALEENHIPIDYIGGSSMGAIIGSLYAMGYTCDEMIAIVSSDDFMYWMTGELKEEDRYYFKEEFPEPELLNVGIDIKDTISKTRLPLSFISSHLMDFAFMEIFARASAAASYNFDSLFVPFLCIGADISNSKEVVFRSGDLAQAVRASMTVPLVFRPIVMDGRLMYDGGIYNNFPANRVKEHFNPDIIIGSKAARGNEPPDEYDVMKQIENIVMTPSDYVIPGDKGVLIDMDFGSQDLLAFDKMDEFVQIGYETTLLKMDSIQMMIGREGPDSSSLNKQRKAFMESWPEFRFGDVEIEGLNEKQSTYVKRSFLNSDSVLGLEFVRREYLKLVSDKSISYIYPRAVYSKEDSLYTFRLRVIPKAPFEAKFGLFISTTGLAQTYLGVSYREIQEVSTHLKGSLQFGRLYDGVNLGFRFDYPSRTPVFFQGSFNYNRFDYNTSNPHFFYEDQKASYIIENEINGRFDVGTPFINNSILVGGLGIGRNQEIYYMTKDFSSTDTSEVSVVNLFSLYGAYEKNTLNNRQFSTKGTFSKFSLRAGYGSESYSPGSTTDHVLNEKMNYYWFSARFENTGYVPLKKGFSLGYHYVIHAEFKPLLSNYFSSIIEAPAFQPTLITKSLFMEDYRANQYIGIGLMPVYSFGKNMHAKLEVYGYFPVQEILRDEENGAYLGNYFSSVKSIFNASVNYLSVVGPVGFHVGYISALDDPWIVQLSFGYLLFNKKSDED